MTFCLTLNVQKNTDNNGKFTNNHINSKKVFSNEERKGIHRENEILSNLVQQFGLNKSLVNPQKRQAVWIKITEEFNKTTGYDWDEKRLKIRWKNYSQALKKSNHEENAITVGDDIRNMSTNSDADFQLIRNIKSNGGNTGRSKNHRNENEILVKLIEEFGLDKSLVNPQKRQSLWIQITEEFNRITGYHWDKKRLKIRRIRRVRICR